MTKMNPEVKAKWVAALRSGKYQQARNQLRKGDAMCCLGVLCDLYDENMWNKPSKYGKLADLGLPPDEVSDWAGFAQEDIDPSITVVISGVRTTLYRHNDGGRTFAQIADAIEEQL